MKKYPSFLKPLINLIFIKILIPLHNLQTKTNPMENNLIMDLKESVSKIRIPSKVISVHQEWLETIVRLREQILRENPKNFLQWEIIRETMFIGNAFFTLSEFYYLRKSNWNKWKDAIIDGNFLFKEPFLLYPKSTGNLIHYAYHVAKFENATGKKIKDFDFIFEYGGGYGGMCQLIHNLGFKGKYIIFDLPIISNLQDFYLKINKLNTGKILCLDKLKDVRKQLPKKGRGLFVATWSLSESPLQIREELFPMIKKMDAFLIGYQSIFKGIDNYKYFLNLQKKLTNFSWVNQEIKHLADDCYYLFGVKKD